MFTFLYILFSTPRLKSQIVTSNERIPALAEQDAHQANDYYQLTSLINKHCELGQKIQIIENLWRVAMIYGHLDAHDPHLMRKLADPLYIGHADYVAAKQKARKSAKLPA